MQKQFCTYEISKELKELGFNEECFGYYSKCYDGSFYLNIYQEDDIWEVKRLEASLWQQAIDWLRKEHNIDIQILRNKPGYNEYRAEIYKVDNTSNYTYLQITEGNNESCKWFHIFEDAREQAILKAIELIKNK